MELNQCIALVDAPEQSLDPLQLLRELQRERSAMVQAADGDLTAARYHLIELRRQRRELVALHGASAMGSLASLDTQIKTLSVALRPLLILEDPSAREILKALPLTPDLGLLIVLNEAQCATLANPKCSPTTGYLARTLARGFKGKTIIPESRHREGSVSISVAPSLSILFLATRDTISRLLTCPLLATEGLAEHIIPVDGRKPMAEAELHALSRIIPAVIDRRDTAALSFGPIADNQGTIDTIRRAGKIRAALQFWDRHTGASAPGNERLEGLVQQVEDMLAGLLAEQEEAVQIAEETAMLEKLQRLGVCRFRQLARTYATLEQNHKSLDPVLTRLEKKRLIGRTGSGRLFAMPKEGDTSSPIQILTH